MQTSIVKGMTALARVADVNEINGGKALVQEAIDSLSLFAHAKTELSTRRKQLIKPDLHSDYKHLCSASIPVTAEPFGEDLFKQVKDISKLNWVGRNVTSNMSHHRGHSHTHFGYKSRSSNNPPTEAFFMPANDRRIQTALSRRVRSKK